MIISWYPLITETRSDLSFMLLPCSSTFSFELFSRDFLLKYWGSNAAFLSRGKVVITVITTSFAFQNSSFARDHDVVISGCYEASRDREFI